MLVAAALVGALFGVDSGRVMPLDPGTLRPAGRSEAVGSMLGPVAWSADRRHVALAVRPAGRVQIVGGPSVETGTRTGWLAWAGSRVFSVGGDGGVAVIDPVAGSVVARAKLSGRVEDAQPAAARLVVLLEEQLAIVAADGSVRLVPLPAVVRGGLATSPETAYVADPSGVVEISLADGAVTRHTLFARAAKDDRPSRSATLLDARTLAVSGCDAPDHRGCASPFGLRLVDVRRWSARMLDSRASAFLRTGRTLVLDATAYGEGRRLGLRAYTPDGILRLSALGGRDVLAQVGAGHAYAHIIGRPKSATRAIDLRTGRIRLLPSRVPYLL
jgi:hypothetical protein